MFDLLSWASEVDPIHLAVNATLYICLIVIFCCIAVPLYLNEKIQDDELGLEQGLNHLPDKRKTE